MYIFKLYIYIYIYTCIHTHQTYVCIFYLSLLQTRSSLGAAAFTGGRVDDLTRSLALTAHVLQRTLKQSVSLPVCFLLLLSPYCCCYCCWCCCCFRQSQACAGSQRSMKSELESSCGYPTEAWISEQSCARSPSFICMLP